MLQARPYGRIKNGGTLMEPIDKFCIDNGISDVEGVKVRLNPDYAEEGSREVFTISYDWDGRKCWIGDKNNRGWYVHYSSLEFVSEAEE
jgi:hypothetical protein